MIKPYNKAEVSFAHVRDISQQGKNSLTFVALDDQLGAEVVIKKIAKATIHSTEDFFCESKVLYASAHANVVQIHYACQDTDNIYIAMPYYKNGSVKGLIMGRHMTIREIVAFGCQILSGIHNIHSKRLIHFDIKPDNILISDRGEALLSDFGLAKQMNFSGIAAQDRIYLKVTPPEAITANQFDRRFDIFQFGLTLYQMCNGADAFYKQFACYMSAGNFNRESFHFDVCNGRFPDRDAFAPHIPIKLKRIVQKSIDPDPNKRFQSAIDVANALAEIDGNLLDWRLSEMDGKRIWTKSRDGDLPPENRTS